MYGPGQLSQSSRIGMLLIFGFIVGLLLYNRHTSPDDKSKPLKASAPPIDDMMISGGLGKVEQKNDEVAKVVGDIKAILEEKTKEKYDELEIIHFKRQVVAGMNYFVKVKAKPQNKIMHLRIYQDLQRKLELTAYQSDVGEGDEIKYFQ